MASTLVTPKAASMTFRKEKGKQSSSSGFYCSPRLSAAKIPQCLSKTHPCASTSQSGQPRVSLCHLALSLDLDFCIWRTISEKVGPPGAEELRLFSPLDKGSTVRQSKGLGSHENCFLSWRILHQRKDMTTHHTARYQRMNRRRPRAAMGPGS